MRHKRERSIGNPFNVRHKREMTHESDASDAECARRLRGISLDNCGQSARSSVTLALKYLNLNFFNDEVIILY